MPQSVYRVTEVIGVSDESWEAAARSAVETAANTVRDLRVAEVVRQDVVIENGRVSGFRVRLTNRATSSEASARRWSGVGRWSRVIAEQPPRHGGGPSLCQSTYD